MFLVEIPIISSIVGAVGVGVVAQKLSDAMGHNRRVARLSRRHSDPNFRNPNFLAAKQKKFRKTTGRNFT